MVEPQLLDTYLKQLRLPTFLHSYRKLADDAARANLGYDRFLLKLVEQEIAQRELNQQVVPIYPAHFADQFRFAAQNVAKLLDMPVYRRAVVARRFALYELANRLYNGALPRLRKREDLVHALLQSLVYMAILDIDAIRDILPHRYPFLLVDRIVEMEPHRIVGLKNVTANGP